MPEACLSVCCSRSFIHQLLALRHDWKPLPIYQRERERETEHWREEGGTKRKKQKQETEGKRESCWEGLVDFAVYPTAVCYEKQPKSQIMIAYIHRHRHKQTCTHTRKYAHVHTHTQAELPPVPMVTWRQGGRDLTIELFTQQQHTHTRTHAHIMRHIPHIWLSHTLIPSTSLFLSHRHTHTGTHTHTHTPPQNMTSSTCEQQTAGLVSLSSAKVVCVICLWNHFY